MTFPRKVYYFPRTSLTVRTVYIFVTAFQKKTMPNISTMCIMHQQTAAPLKVHTVHNYNYFSGKTTFLFFYDKQSV